MYLKRNSITLLSLLCFVLIFASSCKKNESKTDSGKEKISKRGDLGLKLNAKQENALMEEFATLLSNVVREDKDVRIFLKQEAQKKFDLDYDILYQLVKDKKIANKESLREKLLKYADDADLISRIENQLPLLTIFVPELPGDFSADTWKAESEVPAVSTGISRDDKVSYLLADGTKQFLDRKLFPGFPLLGVKNNERVKLRENAAASISNKTEGSILSSDIFTYEFLSESFDGLKATTSGGSSVANYICVPCSPPAKVVTAYDLWAYGYPNDQLWQRDYIYYSISPSSVNGPLDASFQEHLTGIKFKTGAQALGKITDQDDPIPRDEGFRARWSEGYYEFALTVLINSTSGLGSTITKYFPVLGPDIFDVTYTLVADLPGNLDVYEINTITPKQYIMPMPTPIAAWDIKNSALSWKVMLAEVDPSQTYTHQHSVATQFAANFGIDAPTSILKKIGLKFGITPSTTSTNTYTLVTQMDDDQLGEAAMYFYDPIIIYDDIIPNQGPLYTFKDIDTGWAWLTIQPLKVF